MAPNVRKGLKRFLVAYFGLWLLCGLYGAWTQSAATKGFLDASARKDYPELAYWNKVSNTGADFIEAALLMGLIVPVVALIVGGIGLWVYRGFRPKAHS